MVYPSTMAELLRGTSVRAGTHGAAPRPRADAAGAWQPFRGPFQRWPNMSDFLLALLSFVLTLAMWSQGSGTAGLPMNSAGDVGIFLCVFVGNFALLWRRTHPVPVHAVIIGASILVLLGGMSDGIFALAFSLYSLGRYTADDRSSLLGMLAALVLVVVDLFVLGTPDTGSIVAAGLVMLLWYVGRRLRFRGEYLRLLEERALHLERERSVETERAVAEERTRIARELHDIVAHQVSLMTVQAGAAKTVAPSDPKSATDAMAAVEKAGRQALTEMRHLLSVLRPAKSSDDLGPQPGVAHLPRLVAEVSGAGPSVSLTTEGSLSGLPAGLDLTIYRIVQEALTNVLKHAGAGARAEVLVRAGRAGIELHIRDDGAGGAQGVAAPGSGHGIAGMRERAALLGGALSAGPGAERGFEVRAFLPLVADDA